MDWRDIGEVSVGFIATQKMLGNNIGNLFALVLPLLLNSGISTMVWLIPGVTSAMAKDFAIRSVFRDRTMLFH